MCNKIKLLTANDLLQFVKELGIGENRTTLTRYQSAGILTRPHQFWEADVLYNDIPDIRVKFYHPISVVEFIVNTLLYKGYWLKLNSDFRIARLVQSDIFTGRIAFLSDVDMVQEFENRFIDCGIGSFKSFNFTLKSSIFFQEPLVSNSAECLDIDREINVEDCKNGKYGKKLLNTYYLLEQMKAYNRQVAAGNAKLTHYTIASNDMRSHSTLEQLTFSLSYAVFHSLRDTQKYIDYQKMIYARTFEQVINDNLLAILRKIDLKEFRVAFFTGIKE